MKTTITPPLSSAPSDGTMPAHLVYEWQDGKPIAYANWRDSLANGLEPQDIMGCSNHHSYYLSLVLEWLILHMDKRYVGLTGEVDLMTAAGRRCLDLAVFERAAVRHTFQRRMSNSIPPVLVVEVDVQADLSDFPSSESYIYRKIDDLLATGVQQIVWVLTDVRKTIVAQHGQPWQTVEWDHPVPLCLGLTLNLSDLIRAEEQLADTVSE